MDVKLAPQLAQQNNAQEAARIMRKCVHCGFCNATCPTYQMLGDEADGPRGRIYQIREILQTARATTKTRLHLDRCLTCLACETTCPSGVEYSQLLDIGKNLLDDAQTRPLLDRIVRKAISRSLDKTSLIKVAVKVASSVSPVLPLSIRKQLPPQNSFGSWPQPRHQRKMLMLGGCVQAALSPETNLLTAQVLDQLGISLLEDQRIGCCGALGLHTDDRAHGLKHARAQIDAWWPEIEKGAKCIVMTASGCGVTVRNYAQLFCDDAQYREKAARVSEISKDLSEVISEQINQLDSGIGQGQKIVFHPPCTLQHGLQITGLVERILTAAGYECLPFTDPHLCCGSAGTYSLLQPKLSGELRTRKLNALQEVQPDVIVTANVGCQQHLKSKAAIPVLHWISLLKKG